MNRSSEQIFEILQEKKSDRKVAQAQSNKVENRVFKKIPEAKGRPLRRY